MILKIQPMKIFQINYNQKKNNLKFKNKKINKTQKTEKNQITKINN
jgi:hypothetical protein